MKLNEQLLNRAEDMLERARKKKRDKLIQRQQGDFGDAAGG